ncbi:hypothetical protein BDY21DRAFT_288370 [Lineolata rhizophorae]|uniref:HTH APSES-type domain-containing protein n=1 Tax=Lineolata rhizophorae TaxID=578093 RepID=A0A6A6NYD6_9PEZI|nr:hypothetical protein BDY21DRAFT_288370 [Lineolata rhizophorae]
MLYGSQHGMMVQPPAYRSFPEVNGMPQHSMDRPQIYTAVYSGVQVYEMEINGVAVMRRRSDSWLNATQILKVAGVDKGKRTKVLEKEIHTGEHEKVQGGYGKYQGTWTNYRRGREFCRQYGVEDVLRPLLEYDMSADGTASSGHAIETPTKEQAMAANRKRFYAAGLDARSGSQNANGTFFSNISPTASNALAAMNKVARLNSPAPRPGSAAQRRPGMNGRMPSSQPPFGSQESFRGGSQQSFVSERSLGPSGPQNDPMYASQSQSGALMGDGLDEPPRKRMRPSSQDEPFSQPTNGGYDVSMREGTPTEPNESFVYHQAGIHMSQGAEEDIPTALPPLPPPGDKVAEEKQSLLLDLFADPSRVDYSTHPAIQHLSGSDLDLPLDNSANTALHWAATLARVSLMRLLISKGASIFRGNIAGETPLMAAVQVNNCLDHSCFPELLETLNPLIEVRDARERTILHHIAVSSGIKGRAASSKYYLEALLEFLVRSNSSNNSQSNSFEAGNGSSQQHHHHSKPIGLMRFMSEMVNARDKAGNTALNLVARIGNRSIIQQLLEVQADTTICNYKGLRPVDFGVGTDGAANQADNGSSHHQISSPNKSRPASRIEETSKDMMPTLSSFLSQTDSQFSAEIRIKQDDIDRTNTAIRDLSAQQRVERQKLEALRQRIRSRTERRQRAVNLRRAIDEQRQRLTAMGMPPPGGKGFGRINVSVGDADKSAAGFEIPREALPIAMTTELLSPQEQQQHIHQLSVQQRGFLSTLPNPAVLKARLHAYAANNAVLKTRSAALKSRSGELEALYRKVVSLCTGVDESRVEESLAALVAAVESESGDGVEVGRVKEFLRKMEGVEG